MKPTLNSPPDAAAPILAFGAHPDDIEFGAGGVIAKETRNSRAAHFAICSRGESGTRGTPDQRTREAESSARILGATVEFVQLDGDAHLELRASHAIKLAGIIRTVKPGIVLAPSTAENQHPDHGRLGKLVRDACRLARYGGLAELKNQPPHAVNQLLFYLSGPNTEPKDAAVQVLVDVSDQQVLSTWTAAMEAHASQTSGREYVEMQLMRARLNGLRAGIGHAIALFSDDPIVVGSLFAVEQAARRF